MRTDPLRVAGWCVVMLACLLFAAEVRRLTEVPPATVPELPVVTAQVRSPSPPPPAQPPAAEHYVGNTNTHKFHLSTCRYAGCKNCTARFKTRKEAIEAGYRPGGCCDP
ncbi:MAG TPA: hypothetical protein VFP80_04125 [Thermoanaerobaculia bacterium]|nr:hypothetical protein [Thermoanaerobaculia bacterium]